jgi:DNA uptake protein ComE-like DNA-binding protein
VVLILVLLILVAVSALALSLAREVRVELALASGASDAVRLRALADSAIEAAMAEVRADEEPGDDLRAPWRDDEARFRGAQLGGGRYWLLLAEPDPGDGRPVRYGIRDEASKLNVNVATRGQLLALPGITEDAADGIIDWRDGDDDISEFGAEATYYASLEQPYKPKNGFIETLDELLRVRGIDAAMLYGEDRNRNGELDPGEDDGDGSFPPDDADGLLDLGLVDYLTVFSQELDRTADGRDRLSWSDASPQDIDQRLAQAGVNEAARNRLVFLKGSGNEVQSRGQLVGFPEVDEAAAAAILDEITLAQSSQGQGGGEGEGQGGGASASFVPGRINVNTAPREVLAGLPGLEEADVEAILSARLEAGEDGLASPAWLLRVISRQKFQAVADLVTTRSEQFTVHAVALLDDRPRFLRVEAVIDRNYVPFRVMLWRDVTGLGFPFPQERGEDLP